MMTVEIVLPGPHGARVLQLDRSAQIGRAPDNDLVVADSEVSWRHALVYREGDHVLLRDLGSRNGTLVDGVPITGPIRLNDRSRVRIGSIELFVRGVPSPRTRALLIEEVGTGIQHPLHKARYTIGPDEDADLRVPSADTQITLLVPGNGEIWCGVDDEDRPVELGETLVLGRFAFVVREADPRREPTVEGGEALYAYELVATLDGATGPEATLRDLNSSDEIRFGAETRAVLLYILGRQVHRDRTDGRARDEIGWVSDDELIISIWGKTPRNDGLARLKTLLHRVRGGCRAAGFDPWCIEKRRGFTRIRLQLVDVGEGA
ncbi:MAG TPA: FHA domain-containing protein [Deltaproteobacteria bacterium]|nr:FHA domain-containing protein [Deltaproteobacteria bacterium]